MSAASTNLTAEGAHPLLYARLQPIDVSPNVPRIDLHKPKRSYSVGRSPESDIVLSSQAFDWVVCELQWDGRDEVRVVDRLSTNGVWVNRRRIAPGASHVLHDGDTVFFSLCSSSGSVASDEHPPRYRPGANFAYTYHQYTHRSPPLSSADQSVWIRLNELELSCQRLEDELENLRREKEAVLLAQRSIIDGLPEPPLIARPNTADNLQWTWDHWNDIRTRQGPSVVLPEDFRELLRPNTDNVAYDDLWREKYQTFKFELPSPLTWGIFLDDSVEAYHRSGWPDWNDPDLVWTGNQTLDQSRPLTIPPSIIYWSAQYTRPVYAHPRFDPKSTRIYARPYALSSDGFSDLSAARQRRDLGLPALEDPPIVRPRRVLYSLKCDVCPDEDVLAAKVASLLSTLRPDDEMLETVHGPQKERDGYVVDLNDPKRRKRILDDDSDSDDSDISTLASLPLLRSPVLGHESTHGASVSSSKRRKISPSPPQPSAEISHACQPVVEVNVLNTR
ncbi:unnamed protein product [Peniophora sp. CBMAI 1063]|nr:unnamed protein product [Peniophora sp. CBMAI 1063]